LSQKILVNKQVDLLVPQAVQPVVPPAPYPAQKLVQCWE
jgi:hypothetical protein